MWCGVETNYGKKWCLEELAARFLLGGSLLTGRIFAVFFAHTFISSSGMSYVRCLILVRAEREATNVFLLMFWRTWHAVLCLSTVQEPDDEDNHGLQYTARGYGGIKNEDENRMLVQNTYKMGGPTTCVFLIFFLDGPLTRWCLGGKVSCFLPHRYSIHYSHVETCLLLGCV